VKPEISIGASAEISSWNSIFW
jgi:hypothetical protein